MKKIAFLIGLLMFFFRVYSIDTLNVMHYNLLYFGKYTDFCTQENNNTFTKLSYLETIVSFYKPDIFTVNELDDQEYDANLILDYSLNTNGSGHYQRARMTGDYLVNQLYYNNEKLELIEQYEILTYPRIVDVYKLRVLSSEGKTFQKEDPVLFCVVMHLKAGSASSDVQTRKNAAEDVIDYLEENNIKGNVLLMGDMNLYSASEGAFQEFVNTPTNEIRFLDPVDQVGDWNNNYSYRQYHTQSTHSWSSGCHSGGGLDDRFDFILSTENLLKGDEGLRLLTDSYMALGQDGAHFNTSILDSPYNSSVPADVLTALYEMSDHLPVTVKLVSEGLTSINEDDILENINLKFNNPADDLLNLRINNSEDYSKKTLRIYSSMGKKCFHTVLHGGKNETLNIDLTEFTPGIYFIVYEADKLRMVKKLIVH